jgi:hypothetical protein
MAGSSEQMDIERYIKKTGRFLEANDRRLRERARRLIVYFEY